MLQPLQHLDSPSKTVQTFLLYEFAYGVSFLPSSQILLIQFFTFQYFEDQ